MSWGKKTLYVPTEMGGIERGHLTRLRDTLANRYGITNLAPWIEKKTFLDSRHFSFKHHEFQRTILEDDAPTSIVVKCAQVGLSEILVRWALAACATQDDFTVIYTFPTAGDAEKFCRTRIDPCIASSPDLRRLLNKELDNMEIKQFGANSFMYLRGTLSATAALSVPANAIVHDEVDKSDLTQMSVYVSRLQHKPHKLRKLFSTPTVNKYGISKEAETAKRFRQLLKCEHCNEYFAPDYFNNVHIPGYERDKREITKANLPNVRWEEAVLLCPGCGKPPGGNPDQFQWICENPNQHYPANAWFITPFSAPAVISAPYLVKVSTQYEKYSEFINQSLGLTAENKQESITEEDVERCLIQAELADSSTHVMGADMGMLCHVSIGRIASDGTLLIVYREIVPYTNFEVRRRELCAKYRVTISVHDAQPYVDLIDRITKYDPNAYASVFTTGTPGVLFSIKEQEEDMQEGKMNMRRINVTRTMAFDTVMSDLKRGNIQISKQSELDDVWKTHMRSLKRVSKFDRTGEVVYIWEKTDGQDHFHFSLIYLSLAAKMRGLVAGSRNIGSVPMVSSFRVRQR